VLRALTRTVAALHCLDYRLLWQVVNQNDFVFSCTPRPAARPVFNDPHQVEKIVTIPLRPFQDGRKKGAGAFSAN
jgi:hypothetical protein